MIDDTTEEKRITNTRRQGHGIWDVYIWISEKSD